MQQRLLCSDCSGRGYTESRDDAGTRVRYRCEPCRESGVPGGQFPLENIGRTREEEEGE